MRTAVVTGSASGIGKATAEVLAGRGYRVIGVDLRDAEVEADLSTRAGCEAMASEVEKLCGGSLDAVVANAGVLGPKNIQVNYFGAIDTLELLKPMLRRSASPRAAVTSSLAAASYSDMSLLAEIEGGDRGAGQGKDLHLVYGASKAGIARWVRRASPEWAKDKILINAVGPGVVPTPLLFGGTSKEMIDQGVAVAPLKRLGEPREIAEVFAFLVSVENSYMTGQMIYVDGGIDAFARPDKL